MNRGGVLMKKRKSQKIIYYGLIIINKYFCVINFMQLEVKMILLSMGC